MLWSEYTGLFLSEVGLNGLQTLKCTKFQSLRQIKKITTYLWQSFLADVERFLKMAKKEASFLLSGNADMK